jgi:hypothetical protein
MSKLKIALGLWLLFSFGVFALAAEEALPSNNQTPSVIEDGTQVTLPQAVSPESKNPGAMPELKYQGFGKAISALFGIAFLGVIVFVAIGIASFVFWLLMFIHAASKPIENKALWIVILIFTGAIGAIVYYFVVKKKFDLQEKSKTQPPSVPPEAPAPPPGTV